MDYLRLDAAAPRTLAIMNAPLENGFDEEPVSANKNINTWKAMLSTMMSRPAYCADLSAVEMQTDTRVSAIRSKSCS